MTATAEAPTRTRWLPVAVLALGTFATGTDSFLTAGILRDLGDGLGMSLAAAGQFVTGFALANALGAPLVITWLGARPPWVLLLWTMLAFAAANLLAAAAQGPELMWAGRIIAGCLAGVYTPLAAATAARLVPDRVRGRALGLVLGGTSLGLIAGVPLGVWLAGHASWRWAFVLVAALSVLAAAGITALLPRVPAVPVAPLRSRVATLGKPAVLSALLVTVTGMAAGFAVYTYLGPVFGGPVGLLAAVLGLGGLAGVWVGGWLADRYGARPVRTALLAVFTADFLLLGLTSQALWTAIPALLIWGIAGWGFTPAQQHLLISAAPGPTAPIALSLNGSAMYLGIALGSATGGLLLANLGPNYVWQAGASFAVLALALALVPTSVSPTAEPTPTH